MSQSSPHADIDSLWAAYHATEAQLAAIQEAKLAVLASLTALVNGGEADFSSISDGGEGGSESWGIVSLQSKFDSLMTAEANCFALMKQQRELAIRATPGFSMKRTRTLADTRGHL